MNQANGSPNYAGNPAGVVFGGTLSPAAPPPSNKTFPLGLLNFSVTGVAPGATAQVTITPPAGFHSNDYYKYGSTPAQPSNHWYDFLYQQQTDSDDASMTGAVWRNGKIVLNLVDGGRGDDDLTANGTIVDMGGPAVSDLAPQITGPASDVQGVPVEFNGQASGSNAAGATTSWLPLILRRPRQAATTFTSTSPARTARTRQVSTLHLPSPRRLRIIWNSPLPCQRSPAASSASRCAP